MSKYEDINIEFFACSSCGRKITSDVNSLLDMNILYNNHNDGMQCEGCENLVLTIQMFGNINIEKDS